MDKKELLEKVAHDLGYIDIKAFDNALLMEAEIKKNIRDEFVVNLSNRLNEMIKDPYSKYETNGYFIQGVGFAINFIKGEE